MLRTYAKPTIAVIKSNAQIATTITVRNKNGQKVGETTGSTLYVFFDEDI